MIALRRSDVRDLNDRARALMRERGRLGPDQLRVGERDFAVGDQVVTLKNAPRLDVVNGTRGIATRIDERAGGLAVRTTDGRELDLPRAYLASQTECGGPTVDHGYAITGHKAQGMTTDRAFVLGSDELYREWGYVALSRGRVENRLYVVEAAARERDEYAPAERRPNPLDRVRKALGHSRAQTAAIEHTARASAVKPPAYLVKELGPYPERRSQRRAWERAALTIETYRSGFGINDPESAFGPRPRDLRQASLWRDARREAARMRRELGRRPEVQRGLDRSVGVR